MNGYVSDATKEYSTLKTIDDNHFGLLWTLFGAQQVMAVAWLLFLDSAVIGATWLTFQYFDEPSELKKLD